MQGRRGLVLLCAALALARQQTEQMILQDLEFPDLAVGDLKDDRPIVGHEDFVPCPGFFNGDQIPDAVLHLT